ncbi:polysaccharide pyruvyl transferase family protein [Vibrio campbellii]|uniref:polysaccharide pyruvyl transferase family protein n=1 Tax=Vibrio campbellii TaxID=680 RepID=UPI0006807B64|nr:polysaccharide pyruvyl transferase family protein [Vibrio campbellii]
MKIAIMTQPLHTNYGGLLQAYALQRFLKDQGHEVLTIDLPFKKAKFWGVRGIIVNGIKKYILKQDIKRVFPISNKEKVRISKHADRFRQDNIETTHKIESVSKLNELDKYKFSTFIVGSDQVWRPQYSPGIEAFFLNFVKDSGAKKISYAASFGIDNISEFDQELIEKCACHLKQFDAVSVREDSAVNLCRDNFGVEALHVIDPTMLIEASQYNTLIDKENYVDKPKGVMVYVLDRSEEKKAVVTEVVSKLNTQSFELMPQNDLEQYQPVTRWIQGFRDSSFVVTDSFHGVVFSIIYNKPFIAIGNSERGLARFNSLLKMFNLEHRLIDSADSLNDELLDLDMDFTEVNKILSEQRTFASEFLLSAINRK